LANLPFISAYHFDRFIFLHPLKILPITVSLAAMNFAIWHSNAVLGRQSLANLPFILANHFDPFVFLRPLKQFPQPVSLIARHFRL
jgi:hypothetical protein